MKNFNSENKTNIKEISELLPQKDYKKFVVYVFGRENIDYVSQMTKEKRNDLINGILDAAKTKTFYQLKAEFAKKFAIQLCSIIAGVLIVLPLIILIAGSVFHFSQSATQDNYKSYSSGFEKLYKDRKYPGSHKKLKYDSKKKFEK